MSENKELEIVALPPWWRWQYFQQRTSIELKTSEPTLARQSQQVALSWSFVSFCNASTRGPESRQFQKFWAASNQKGSIWHLPLVASACCCCKSLFMAQATLSHVYNIPGSERDTPTVVSASTWPDHLTNHVRPSHKQPWVVWSVIKL